ncbi:MAG: hypothetical protein ACLP59_12730 [Bryobacteraceae bacterium]
MHKVVKNNLALAYLLLVGVPVLGLLGILEAGRGIVAPIAISGEWTLQIDPAAACANDASALLRQQGFSVSQSGPQALLTLHDGRGTTFEATVDGPQFAAKLATAAISARISGKPGSRTLEGKIAVDGCAPVNFRAVRQSAAKGGA